MIIRVLAVWLLLLTGAGAASAQSTVSVRYDIELTIDPATGTLRARALLRPEREVAESVVLLSSDLNVEQVRIGGKPVDYSRNRERLSPARRYGPDNPLEVVYSGKPGPIEATNSPFLPGLRLDPEGGFLPDEALWYPYPVGVRVAGLRLDLTVLGGQTGIAPGRIVSESRDGERYRARFESDHPLDGITVFTGPYRIAQRFAGQARIRTYFHPELEARSDTYLEAVSRYLDRYASQIGAYPYAGFSVVSSPLPVGLGYPYLTYMGRRVLHLPFIVHTSLPHEVLHSWWGNGVFVDYERGNWAEGLTTYMADYALAAARGPQGQRDMRARWLADYAALPPGRDQALLGFRARYHSADQVVGYNKAAMLFHMLERSIGSEAFADGLQRFWRQQKFQSATWLDLARAFEAAAGRDLTGFFEQWLQRKGAPELRLEAADVEPHADGYRVRVRLGQVEPAYDLTVPVRLEAQNGSALHNVSLSASQREVTLASEARPTGLSLDPDFDLFRRLPPGDAPAVLRGMTLAERIVLTVEPGDAEFAATARELAARLSEGEVADSGDGPLLLIGRPDWIGARAVGALAPPADLPEGTARVWVRRDGDGRLVMLIAARDRAAVAALMRPLPHYGSKSFLAFDGRQAVHHGTWNDPPRSTTVYFE